MTLPGYITPRGRPPSVQERIKGSTQSSGLRDRIAKAWGPNATVISASYLGRDATGRAMYRVVVVPTAAYERFGAKAKNRTVRTITFVGGQIGKPNLEKADTGGQSDGQGGTGDSGLTQAKDYWISRVNGLPNADPAAIAELARYIENFQGSSQALSQAVGARITAMMVDPGQAPPDFGFDDIFGGGGGFGGSGGFGGGPEYRKPDRRVVEDMVSGMATSLIGTTNDAIIEAGADLYMRDHRRNFDSLDEEIDPSQSVLEYIRGTEDYQTVHALRPESEDERTWVSQRKAAAAQGGLTTGAQEDFAITQATVGGDIGDVRQAASQAQFQESGSARGTLLQDQIRNTVQGIFSGVKV